MKPFYKFIEHTADVLFQAQAGSLAELFVQCALALEDTQVNIKKIKAKEKLEIKVEGKNQEDLLFEFLDDLIFYKDVELLIFNKFDILIEEKGGKYILNCTAQGEKLDPKKHEPKVDVKAITMHLFEVKKIKDGWQARVLLDV